MTPTPTDPSLAVPEDQLPKDDFADDATAHDDQTATPLPGSPA